MGDPAPNLAVVDGFPAAFVNALGLGGFDAGALPGLDELQFHIRDHAQDGDHHPAHVATGGDLGLQDAQRSAARVQFVDQVEDVAG